MREFINKHKGISAAALVLLVAGAAAFPMWLNSREVAQFGPDQDKAWFTVDDGKSYFAAPLTNTSPHQADGKTAYRCFVFKCAERPTPFVAYLQRDAAAAQPPSSPPAQSGKGRPPRPMPVNPKARAAPAGGVEVKAPGTGDKGWVGMLSGDGLKLVNVRCADKTPATPVTP